MPLDFFGNFDDTATVTVAGVGWGGWTQVEVTREINAASGSFQVDLTAPNSEFPFSDISGFLGAAQPDCPCTVTCGGHLVITGRIDTRTAQKDGHNHTINISGRSEGRQAVDSSHIDPDKTAQYNDLKPSQISKKVTDALGIKLKSEVTDEKKIEWFRYNLGESSLNVVRNACLKQGITIGHDADGSVTLKDMFTDTAPGSLILGENILRYTVRKSAAHRNSEYQAKGQKLPNEKMRGKQACQQKAEAKDEGLKSYRPKYITGLGDTDDDELDKRVKFEAAQRQGVALDVTITVVGWTHNGGLWEPGQLTFVSIPDEDVAEQLLIKTVKFVKDFDPTGTLTEMTLVRPEAFQKGMGAGGKGAPGGSGMLGGAIS